jgi:putative NADPH-quinone reductase
MGKAMNVLVVVGHPNPQSFNHAVARSACDALRENGHRVIFHDLSAEAFDPVLPGDEIPESGRVPSSIRWYAKELAEADGIIVVHPNWWGQPPALMKGWIDRVFRPGVAYRFVEGDSGEGVPEGLLKAHAAVVFNTSNTPAEREQSVFGDPLETLWKNCVFGLCGVPDFHRRTFAVIVTSTPEKRKQWLTETARLVCEVFPKTADSCEQHPAGTIRLIPTPPDTNEEKSEPIS